MFWEFCPVTFLLLIILMQLLVSILLQEDLIFQPQQILLPTYPVRFKNWKIYQKSFLKKWLLAANIAANHAAICSFHLNLDEWRHNWQHHIFSKYSVLPIVPPFIQIFKNGWMAAHWATNCAAIHPDLNKMDEWRHTVPPIVLPFVQIIMK